MNQLILVECPVDFRYLFHHKIFAMKLFHYYLALLPKNHYHLCFL